MKLGSGALAAAIGLAVTLSGCSQAPNQSRGGTNTSAEIEVESAEPVPTASPTPDPTTAPTPVTSTPATPTPVTPTATAPTPVARTIHPTTTIAIRHETAAIAPRSSDTSAEAGVAADPAPPPPPPPAPTSTPAPGESWCDAADDNVSPAECARLTGFVQHLKIGEAGISAPETMYVGDTDQLTFAITNNPTANPVGDVLGGTPTETMPVKVTRRMAAELTGVGFEIKPAGNQARDLSATGGAFWSWTITAQPGASHKLDLSVYVNSARANEPPELHLVRVLHRNIKVKVRIGDRVDKGIKRATDQSTGLTTLMKALLGLVVAAGALWAAIRTFGKKSKPEEPPANTPH
ncbi:MAG: hypothetical protein ABI471_02020 [Sphingomonas bacterium]